MVYLIKISDSSIGTYFSEDAIKKDGYNLEDALKISNEEFNKCGGSSYIAEDGKIYLGINPSIKNKLRIRDLRQFLSETDYIDNKIVEGDATIDDYREIIEKRKAARREIDKLEQ